jgi:hypothetical protein
MIKSIKKIFKIILARIWPDLAGIWPESGQILAQTGLTGSIIKIYKKEFFSI